MNRKLKWIASILLACGLFACKHGKDSGQKQEPTKPEITLSIQAGSDKVSEASLQGGVPYTISNVLQAAGKKLTVTPALKNATNATEEIKAEITEPASTPPLTVTKNASGVFELGFTKVTESTPVKIKFYTETTNLEKIISFTLLPEPVINDFELAETSGAFGIGAKQKIKVTPIYSDAKKYFGLSAQELNVVTPKPAFSFASDDNSVVEVDSNGLFTTKVQGSAKITVTLGTTPPVAKDYTVTVENVTAPNELLVQNPTSTVQNAFNLKVGDNVTIKLVANPTNGSLILQNGFSCDNTSIAKIAPVSGTTDKYTITALKNGTANFSAISKYNSELKINIKVTVSSEVLTGLTVTPNQKTLTVGETFQLSVTAAPASASNSVTWTSSKPESVSVDEYGLVTVRKEDAAPVVITARSNVDDTKKAISIIKVAKKAESISLNKTLLESLVGEKPTFTATVSPADASQDVKWTLSDTNLASLNTAIGTNVELTCKKTGTLKLTATAVSNPEAKAEATVYIVNKKVTGIVFYNERGTEITTEQDLVTNTNDNVFYFAIKPKDYSWQSANQEYTLECSSSNITINESEPSSYLYTKKLTISVGNLEKTDTVTITSKVNPLKKAILSIKAATKKVTSIEVPNKTVFLGESGAKMTATVTPKQALQTVKWSCDNPSVAYVDENSGEITPVGKGTATVTATAQDGSGITGSGTLTVREALTNYTVNWTNGDITYYGKEGITFKVTPNPADGYANFTATCDNADITIDKKDDFTFAVTVKNKEAKTATSTITVSAGGTSIPDETLSLRVKSNEIASIDTSFYTATWKKMYKNETKTVPLSAFIADSGHPDMSLLDIKIMSGTRDKTWYFDTASLAEGTLKIKRGYEGYYENLFDNEERLTVKVTNKSGANLGSVELTIYDNVAEIQNVSCSRTETTIGDSWHIPEVSLTLVKNQNVYKKFAITEQQPYFYDTPTSSNLKKAVYELDGYSPVTITPKAHTSGVPKTFYVFPIDPKTGKAVTDDTSKTFRLTIWEKATGIELSGGNFDIIKLQSGGYDIRLQNLVHNQPDGTYWFYAKIIPEYSKPVELKVKKLINQGALKNIEWNLQSDGRTKISFGTYKSGIGVAEEDTLLIYLNDTIGTTLKVKIN
jgi:possible surface protein, responsible for cell interaction; contains cell adhesion domain and chW-repeats